MRDIVSAEQGEIKLYDPVEGLEIIAIAEIGEKYWARTKDAEKLFEAIETKITAQAEYVVWRDGVIVPSQEQGKQKKPDGISVLKLQRAALPTADPGDVTAHRWRRRLCGKSLDGQTIIDTRKIDKEVKKLLRTVIDRDKMAVALEGCPAPELAHLRAAER